MIPGVRHMAWHNKGFPDWQVLGLEHSQGNRKKLSASVLGLVRSLCRTTQIQSATLQGVGDVVGVWRVALCTTTGSSILEDFTSHVYNIIYIIYTIYTLIYTSHTSWPRMFQCQQCQVTLTCALSSLPRCLKLTRFKNNQPISTTKEDSVGLRSVELALKFQEICWIWYFEN